MPDKKIKLSAKVLIALQRLSKEYGCTDFPKRVIDYLKYEGIRDLLELWVDGDDEAIIDVNFLIKDAEREEMIYKYKLLEEHYNKLRDGINKIFSICDGSGPVTSGDRLTEIEELTLHLFWGTPELQDKHIAEEQRK